MNAEIWWTMAAAGGTWLGVALVCTLAFSRARPQVDRESLPPGSIPNATRMAVPVGNASASVRE